MNELSYSISFAGSQDSEPDISDIEAALAGLDDEPDQPEPAATVETAADPEPARVAFAGPEIELAAAVVAATFLPEPATSKPALDPLNFAPGCFGRAGAYEAGSAECSSCPFAAECAPISRDRTQRFDAMLKAEPEPAAELKRREDQRAWVAAKRAERAPVIDTAPHLMPRPVDGLKAAVARDKEALLVWLATSRSKRAVKLRGRQREVMMVRALWLAEFMTTGREPSPAMLSRQLVERGIPGDRSRAAKRIRTMHELVGHGGPWSPVVGHEPVGHAVVGHAAVGHAVSDKPEALH